MLDAIFILGIAAGLYVLVRVGWPDFLRLVKGTRRAFGTVSSHVLEDGGFLAVISFEDGSIQRETRAAFNSAVPDPPLGAKVLLQWPAGYPQLARPRAPFKTGVFYVFACLWIALFYDLLTGKLL